MGSSQLVDAAASCTVEVTRVEKPWGYELIWALSEDYCGKVLFVRAGEALSLQYHERKDETIHLQAGAVELEFGDLDGGVKTETVEPGRSFRIAPRTVHRIRAIEDSLVLEVSTPHLDDVVRLEDRYGRGPGSSAGP
jgi:mannose-6-phosphate isomerase-like protein (cupin superfamily)